MDFTNLFALTGCITGVISLVISLRNVFIERFKLVIYFFENENMYFNKLESCKQCRTKLQGVIRARLENRSSNPVTIFSMTLLVDNAPVLIRQFDGNLFTITTYIDHDGKTEFIEVPMDKQIILPLRLDAYDAMEGMVFIPFYPDTDKICQKIVLTAKTTKGSRSKKSKIWIKKPIIDDGEGPFYE